MKRILILIAFLAGCAAGNTTTPDAAPAAEAEGAALDYGKTCSPTCKSHQTCRCTFNNGSACAEDHPILGSCNCRCY